MLDMDFVLENPDAVKHAIEVKGVELDLNTLIALHGEVKKLTQRIDDLRHERNILSKQVAGASGTERDALVEKSRAVGDQLKQLEPSLRERQDELVQLQLRVPNIPAPDEPVGMEEEENVELRRWGDQPVFSFDTRDHVELLDLHNWWVGDRAAKVAGSRSYALKGEAALLEQAVLRMALDYVSRAGFVPVGMPSLAREAAFLGTGHFPAGRDDVYVLREDDDLFLSGTAEVGLNYLHSGEILSHDGLPVRYAGFSPCFRREAGSAGRDVRGLTRVHQFYKVEQYVMCASDRDESSRWFETLLANAEALLQALELPYRVVRVCTGQMGVGKVRMWDIETWVPSQQHYVETHSNSEFYDWQARRADLRYRGEDGKVRHAFTLNNTAIATPRILVPLLEVHQQPDGTVRVPEALRPYLGIEVLAAGER